MVEYKTMPRSAVSGAQIDAGLRTHMNKVYGLMSTAMVVTAIFAWVIGNDYEAAVNGNATLLPFGMLQAMFTSPISWIIMFAPLGFIFMFAARINQMSVATARNVFYGFAAVMGVSLSSIFVVYTDTAIFKTFLTTAIAFAGLSLYGYTTKRDLSGFGTFLIMGVIGVFAAAILNIWLASGALSFAISVIGLLVFAGLTAYDTQKIKNTYLQMAQSGQTSWLEKSAIMGALSLYLDFINMFMFMLQLFGGRE